MSHEAIPIYEALAAANNEHPEGGEKFSESLKKRTEEIKKRSTMEKKQCSLSYRGTLSWAGIHSQEEFEKKYEESVNDYYSGNFFMERIGRYREVDAPLTLVLLHLRAQWIVEYDIKTIPEFILLDMALTSYFHYLRLNEAVNNTMASIEWEYFALDAPSFRRDYYGTRLGSVTKDQAIAEELAHRLSEVLQPLLELYNRMFIRNLKAIRDLKRGNIQLNIGSVGQMNIGEKQLNVEKG